MSRVKHWLPISSHLGTSHAEVVSNDMFSKGTIVSIWVHQGKGVLKTNSGKELSFDCATLNLIDPNQHFYALTPGMAVGYDKGRTSLGEKIVTLCVY